MKGLLFFVVAVAFSLHQCEAIKCYFCLDACKPDDNKVKSCGSTIGDSQEAVCTTEITKESKTPEVAIRKCQIVQKGTDAPCPPNAKCTSCKSDLCNAAPSLSANMALMGAVASVVFAKLLLN